MAAIKSVADLTLEGDVAVLTINSPPVNALSSAVRDGLRDGMRAAAADPAAKAPWMVRKIIAYDVPAQKSSPLVPRGFVTCTNAGYNLVSLEIGDLESRFAIGSAFRATSSCRRPAMAPTTARWSTPAFPAAARPAESRP